MDERGKKSRKYCRLILYTFGRIARISKQINKHLSFHLLIWLIMQSLNITLIFCIARLTTNNSNFFLILRIFLFGSYIGLISKLNENISIRLKNICKILLQPYWKLINQQQLSMNNNRLMFNDETLIIRQFDPIRLYQLTNIYEQDFQMSIYQFTNIDFSFLITLTLFIIEYGVFIVQTSL
uniref:Uncharacterized protein LOC113793092 n=1 Tax=Dermatophagoides pteronyssinus TaxID=6956 RepID=A0A6P6Y079_DERPT|nr:uncharacterized protein LOC113793092 [Dermatophagoides pteronyssinus]